MVEGDWVIHANDCDSGFWCDGLELGLEGRDHGKDCEDTVAFERGLNLAFFLRVYNL